MDNIKSLGFTSDHELSFDIHVNLVCRACNYYLWSLRHIRKFLTVDMANTISCKRGWRSLGLLQHHLYKKTKANYNQIATCTDESCLRSVAKLRRAHAEDLLAQLHWLPVGNRIDCKIALITLKFGQTRYLAASSF